MTRKYFGTDGVRGKVGEYPITPDFVLRLGYAAGKVLAAKRAPGEHAAVLIGKDTRISGYMLEAALEAGLSAAGVDVLLAGPIPTPGVAYLTRALRLSAGVVISASHNPFDDNGIKFFGGGGLKLDDAIETEIENMLDVPMQCVGSSELGKARRIGDAAGRYIEFCKSTFPAEMDLRGLKIVVDCANGAGYHIAPPVFHELGAEVVAIANQPNGTNINDECGATHLDLLQKAVVEHQAHFGIALDGDGDRLMMVDESGRVYDGDHLLYIMATARQDAGLLQGGVVGTLMTNLGVEHALGRRGIPFARAKVGDRYVLELLKQNQWQVGGEGSGHLLCLDKHSTGDAIVSALQVLAALKLSGKTLGQAVADVEVYPQRLVNVRVRKGFNFRESLPIQAALVEAECELNGKGRVLLRPSGTEPVIRVMVEANDAGLSDHWAGHLAKIVEAAAV